MGAEYDPNGKGLVGLLRFEREIDKELKKRNKSHFDKLDQLKRDIGPIVALKITPMKFDPNNPFSPDSKDSDFIYFFLQEVSLRKYFPNLLNRIKDDLRNIEISNFIDKYRPFLFEIEKRELPTYWIYLS